MPTSGMGHKRTSEREPAMSALPLIADPRPLVGLFAFRCASRDTANREATW